MIVAYTAGWRMANQVFHYLYLMALALEFDLNLKIIDFRHLGYFDFFGPGKSVCSYHPRWVKFLHRMCRSNKLRPFLKLLGIRSLRVYWNEESGWLAQEVKNLMKGLTFLDCWPVVDYELLYKHQEAIRNTFRPKKEYWDVAENIMAEQRSHGVPVVGVHVRRTDYKEWLDGKHFYEVPVYARFMRKISELMNGEVVFVICSDEEMKREDFDVPCRAMYISHNPFMVDYSLLTHCDYTIGPPSTFRMTSAFLGNTPSFAIDSPDRELTSMGQFIVPLMGNAPAERKHALQGVGVTA